MINFALGCGAMIALAIVFPSAFKWVLTYVEDMWARVFGSNLKD